MTKQLIFKSIVLGFLLAIQVYPACCQQREADKHDTSHKKKYRSKKKEATTESEKGKTILYFNDKGEWINGFPERIKQDSTILKWDLPKDQDTRVLKKIEAAIKSVDTLTDDGKVTAFLNKHSLLYRLFDNTDTLPATYTKSDLARIKKTFIDYKDGLHKYFKKLDMLKNFSKAKKETDSVIYYFPDFDADYTESFSVIAKNQYGKPINTSRLNKRELIWKSDTSITFTIYRELRDNQVIAEHYKKSYEKYKPADWIFEKQKEINLENKELLKEFEELMTQWERERKMGEPEKAAATMETLISKNTQLQRYITKTRKILELLVQENREWIKCWLWFTDWEPVLNPLDLRGFSEDAKMGSLKKSIDSSKENINYLTKFIENKNIEKFKNFDELKKATEQLAGMSAAVKKLEADYAKLEKEKIKSANGLDALKTEKQLVQTGELFGSNNQKWQPMHFHNFSKGLELVNKTKGNRYVWDGDEEKLIAVNVPAGVNVSLVEKIDPYVPKTFFSNLIDPLLDEFWKSADGSLASLQEQGKQFSNLLNSKSITQSPQYLTLISEMESTKSKNQSLRNDIEVLYAKKDIADSRFYEIFDNNPSLQKDNKSTKRKLKIEIDNLNHLLRIKTDSLINVRNDSIAQENKLRGYIRQYLAENNNGETKQEIYVKAITTTFDSVNILKKWFSLQTNAFPAYDLSTPDDTVYRSLPLQPKEAIAAGNNGDSYTIFKRTGTNKEEKASTWNFKKYELKRLDAIAGLAFVNSERSSLIYDGATQTFSSKSIGSSDLMLGIKFFPVAGMWQEDKRLFGRGICFENIKRGTSFINRIAITGAVGVQKSPLRNFFTGFSYDIITGLSVNYGWNFYTKKDYDIKNGVVENEYESFVKTPYWGITMAPATLLKLLKIINLKP